MSSRGQFFIIFFITCIFISVLFYLAFRRTTTPLFYPYLSKTPTGLPGMDRKPMKQSKPASQKNSNLGKPLPEPKLPTPPVPLVVKVAPPGPPIEKPMMT
jgi:hypothetical protein